MTPSQLNRLARDLLEGSFGQIWLEAEVSGFTRAASGHWYFTLKDARAQIRCAMFKGANRALANPPINGDQVQARGKVSLFEARGDFQFIIDRLQPAGLGAILRAFEALKAKLASEGLFAADRKRPLPRIPNRIAIVSSAKGAAIADVLSILGRRWPLLSVDLYPTNVQGNEAAAEMRDALNAIAARGAHYDLVLLTRGGGAREDLLPFDDEALARVIAAQPQPVVSAVGHEIDFTIADLAADLRAPTPSAGAELIAPDAVAVSQMLDQQQRRIRRGLENHQRAAQQRQDLAASRLAALSPDAQLKHWRQSLRADRQLLGQLFSSRLAAEQRLLARLHARVQTRWPAHRLHANSARLQRLNQRLSALAERWSKQRRRGIATSFARLTQVPLANRLHARRAIVNDTGARLPRLLQRLQQLRSARLQRLHQAIENLGPNRVLARGYALLIDPNSRLPVRSVAELTLAQALRARLVDGEVDLNVTSLRKPRRS